MFRLFRAILNILFRPGRNTGSHTATESGGERAVLTGGVGERTEHVLMNEDGTERTLYVEDKSGRKLPSGQVVRLTRKELVRDGSGRVLGYGNDVAGICGICSATVGAKSVECCEYCGNVVCRRHSYRLGGKTYCTAHVLIGAFRVFTGV